ncbi:MAG: response regulator [Rhodospirillales bacterium]|nr:response regulator [Rhodospirillales bacterium]
MIHILCIEDEADLREEIVFELNEAGYKVSEASNGIDGLKLIEDQRPDLILCDVSMPKMTGRELLSELRRRDLEFAETPFVFLSALADREDLISGMELGADEYLTKPIDFEILLTKVKSSLRLVNRLTEKKQVEHVKIYKALTEGAENLQTGPLSPLRILMIGKAEHGASDMHKLLSDQGHDLTWITKGTEFVKRAHTMKADLTFIWVYSDDMEANMILKIVPEKIRHQTKPWVLVRPDSMRINSNLYPDSMTDYNIGLPLPDNVILENIATWTKAEA